MIFYNDENQIKIINYKKELETLKQKQNKYTNISKKSKNIFKLGIVGGCLSAIPTIISAFYISTFAFLVPVSMLTLVVSSKAIKSYADSRHYYLSHDIENLKNRIKSVIADDVDERINNAILINDISKIDDYCINNAQVKTLKRLYIHLNKKSNNDDSINKEYSKQIFLNTEEKLYPNNIPLNYDEYLKEVSKITNFTMVSSLPRPLAFQTKSMIESKIPTYYEGITKEDILKKCTLPALTSESPNVYVKRHIPVSVGP